MRNHEKTIPPDVQAELLALGLDYEVIREAAAAWVQGRDSVGPLMPAMIPGLLAWGSCVESLRGQLIRWGWVSSNECGLDSVTNPAKNVAIFVTSGDENTGLPGKTCSSKYKKGSSTVAAVRQNNQLRLLPEEACGIVRKSHKVDLWALVLYRNESEVRFELSLPKAVGENGRLIGWRKDIKFPAIALTVDVDTNALDEAPEVDVILSRKASS